MNTNYKMLSKLGNRAALLLLLVFGFTLSAWSQIYVQVGDSFPDLNNSSAAWGDIDNDGDMDLALSGMGAGTTPYAGIWVNNGNGSFSELPMTNFTPSLTQIAGYTPHSLSWGDYNNDGQIDLAIVGRNGANDYAKIWRNDGSNMFFNSFDMVPGKYSAVAWGDADNDGDEDLMLIGESNINNGSVLMLNNYNSGSISFSTSAVAFPHLTRGACDFGDYDADGDLDIIMCGYLDGNGATPATQLWDNDGEGNYTLSLIPFTGLGWGDLDWSDTDCDGDLDLMMTGFTGPTDIPTAEHLLYSGNVISPFDTAIVGMPEVGYSATSMGDYDHDGYPDMILQGDSSGFQQPVNQVGRFDPALKVFFPDASVVFQELSQGDLHWIDYDMDGDLDIYSGGLNNITATNLYENIDTSVSNSPPSAPAGLSGTAITNTSVEWAWTAATDDKTPAAGLSYRLIVERQSDFQLMTPTYSNINTEKQNISDWGSIKGTSWVMRGLDPNETYCAVVIAVDGGMAASTWSTTACASVVVGIDDADNAFTINAWPTPATTVLNVSLNGLSGSGTLSIAGLDGRVLHTEDFSHLNQKQLDVSGLAHGVYLLSVQVEGQSAPTSLRFIKN